MIGTSPLCKYTLSSNDQQNIDPQHNNDNDNYNDNYNDEDDFLDFIDWYYNGEEPDMPLHYLYYVHFNNHMRIPNSNNQWYNVYEEL